MCRSPDYIGRAGVTVGFLFRMRRKFTIRLLQKGDAKGASGFEYSIAINKYIVNDKDISDTVAHELLHTIKTAKTTMPTGNIGQTSSVAIRLSR